MPNRSSTKASPARLAALNVIRLVRERNAFAQNLIEEHIDTANLKPEDRAFATRLVLGVVSSQGTLDEVIDRALRSPNDVKPNVRDALRLSTYEIIFLEKSSHAAVDQGVEIVRSVAPRATGLANATLRKIVDLKQSFPFGDPRKNSDALARLYAFPAWLAKQLIDELGKEDAVAFMRASNEPAPLFVAVNAIKAEDQKVRTIFEQAGTSIEPASVGEDHVEGCYLVSDGRFLLMPEVKQLFSQGKLLVSDAASQLIAFCALPDCLPCSFLEIGAGRATKTILLQSDAYRRYAQQITPYVTLDNHEYKGKLLQDRTERYGVHVSEVVTGDAVELDTIFDGRSFDMVFIDAPCSGLGTLRRHPEIRWRISPEDFQSFAQVQLDMLRSAASHVSPEGRLIYSTCTVSRAENEKVVESFLASAEGRNFTVAPLQGHNYIATRLYPGSADAHFAIGFVNSGSKN